MILVEQCYSNCVFCAGMWVQPACEVRFNKLCPPFQLRMCMGVGTLFYARSFPYTIVFCQAFRVNGWPQVRMLARMLETFLGASWSRK